MITAAEEERAASPKPSLIRLTEKHCWKVTVVIYLLRGQVVWCSGAQVLRGPGVLVLRGSGGQVLRCCVTHFYRLCVLFSTVAGQGHVGSLNLTGS